MTIEFPNDPTPEHLLLEARLHLMDRQILDARTIPVSAVDDVEFSDPSGDGFLPLGEPAPVLTNLITGLSLGARIFGGRPPRRLLHRIRWSDVREVGTAITLSVRGDDLEATWFERWACDRVIRRIPGGSHAPE